MQVKPLVLENIGLIIVAIIFGIACTISVITHIALFDLIFNLEFCTLGVK